MQILSSSFYQRKDTLQVAKELLGKILVTSFDGVKTSGMIVEVEAYLGIEDKACHAFSNRRTDRTEPMFGPGGNTYVYLCYGIHHLLNIVTHVEWEPHAILIRAVEPLEGMETMLKRRNKKMLDTTLTSGPGALSQALGITTHYTNNSLQWPYIRIEDRGIEIKDSDIVIGSRVGVAYAWEDATLPYRFSIKWNPFVSRAKWI